MVQFVRVAPLLWIAILSLRALPLSTWEKPVKGVSSSSRKEKSKKEHKPDFLSLNPEMTHFSSAHVTLART